MSEGLSCAWPFHHMAAKRDREDEDLDHAIAASLQDFEDGRPPPLPPLLHDPEEDALERAIAASMQSAAAATWDCRICTFGNSTTEGRCTMCGSDRIAPYAAKASMPKAQSEWRCGLPGCAKSRTHFDFCSEDHQRRAAQRGLLAPQSVDEERVFCGASGDYACALLTNKSAERASVVQQFREKWSKPEPCPRVERVYSVRPTAALSERYERHAAAVGNQRRRGGEALEPACPSSGMCPAREPCLALAHRSLTVPLALRRRFHGTGSECDFAIDDSVGPCASASCALCSILAKGFSLAHAGTGPNAGRANFGTAAGLRYGRGLYFSSTSGKSNDYAGGSERVRRGSRRWRTLFLCQVAAGKAFCTTATEHNFTRPPDGHDSVVGEPSPGGLNYDELVVYTEDAALPTFLIVVSFDR